MASKVQLRVKDSGQLKILSNFRMTLSGGVHEEDGTAVHDKGPLSVLDVASVNEFGGGKIPARMWLRGWVPKFAPRFVTRIRDTMVRAVRTQKFDQGAFEPIVYDLMQSLRGRILRGEIRPVNAPATLAKKRPETRPLFEWGQLVASIKGRLRSNNGWKAERG